MNSLLACFIYLSITINTSDLAGRSSIKQQPLKIATDTAPLTETCVTVNDPFSNQGSIKCPVLGGGRFLVSTKVLVKNGR